MKENKKVLVGYLNERENNKNNFLIRLFLLLFAFFVCGFFNRILANNIVKADETDGLLNNYTAYSITMSNDTKELIEDLGEGIEFFYDSEYGEWLEDSYVLCSDFLLSRTTYMLFDSNLLIECSVENNVNTDNIEVVYDSITFSFRGMTNAKVLLVPNSLANYLDEAITYYTYGADNLCYPLNQVIHKLEDSSVIYGYISDLDPFNVLVNFGRDHYIYYYGTANYNYLDGYNDGYFDGVNANGTAGILGVWKSVFGGMTNVLNVEILPSITIAMVLSIPIVFGLIILLYKFIGRG